MICEGAVMKNIKLTVLCYIQRKDEYLMLFRNKKNDDENKGKWIGVGGKLEKGESPAQCMLREVREETGLKITEYAFRGVITFISDIYDDEYMFLYEGLSFEGDLSGDCNEGELKWIPKDRILSLPMWEGDRYFLEPMLNGEKEISLRLEYKGEQLIGAARE